MKDWEEFVKEMKDRAEEDLKKVCNQLAGRYRQQDEKLLCILPKSIDASGVDLDSTKNKLQITISGTPYFIKSDKPMMLGIVSGKGELSDVILGEKESAVFGKIKLERITVKDTDDRIWVYID